MDRFNATDRSPAQASPLHHLALSEHRQYAEMPALRHGPPLPANGCRRARSISNSLISRNSRSARSASASSKGRSCRHCSDRRKSRAGRNSASRHRTRNNLGLDRYTKGAGCGAPCAKPKLSGRKAGMAVIRWLMIARQEAVSVPAWRRPFMNRRSRRDDRQQRQDDSNQ